MTEEKELKPSDVAKRAGLDDLSELSYLTDQSEQTLINWFKNPKKRKLFDCAALGAAVIKHQETNTPGRYWLYGVRKIKHRHSDDDERFNLSLYKFAQHCIERFPDSIGHPEATDKGLPRHTIRGIDDPWSLLDE